MFPRIGQFKSLAQFQAHLAELRITLPLVERIRTAAEGSPLAEPLNFGGLQAGNRWCIHPMEGWDGNPDGTPSDKTLRRWSNFGKSGAKLIWGGEAAAVRADGRANPHQLMATKETFAGLVELRRVLLDAHRQAHGRTDDLVIGLQLTHSGRFAFRPTKQQRPRVAFEHPLLDQRFGFSGTLPEQIWTDDELREIGRMFVGAAHLAHEAGFQFVDIKSCHSYLLQELMAGYTRPGHFGGDFAGRTRLLRWIIEQIRRELPDLMIGARINAFDCIPFIEVEGAGVPMPFAEHLPYRFGFGVHPDRPLEPDFSQVGELVQALSAWGVTAVNVSGGSPYYAPHMLRPAAFPPTDGYPPPEDPLVGVSRLLSAARHCKQAAPNLLVVAGGLTYLQEFLPYVAEGILEQHWADSVGIGRMVLSYPEFPADVLKGTWLDRKRICRTFSECTSGPRNNLVSGCFPLDPFYKSLPDWEFLRQEKERRRKAAAD